MRTFIFVFLCSSLCLTNCGFSSEEVPLDDNTAVNQEETIQDSESDSPKEIEVISIISDLNVRSTPGKEGIVIDKLGFGQRAIWYGEETDYKEKIIMRNIPRFSSWKKVRFSGSGGKGALDGWVYGGGIVLKDEAYVQENDSVYRRNLSAVSGEELSELLGIEISSTSYSSGFLVYKQKSDSKALELDGRFKFSSNNKARKEGEFSFELAGRFIQGKLEGEVEKEVKGIGYEYKSTLLYESGHVKKASISGDYLGENIGYSTEKPSECSFEFLEKTLQ